MNKLLFGARTAFIPTHLREQGFLGLSPPVVEGVGSRLVGHPSVRS